MDNVDRGFNDTLHGLASMSIFLGIMGGVSALWSGRNPFLWGTAAYVACMCVAAVILSHRREAASGEPD